MQTLIIDTSGQTLRLTLDEGRQYYSDGFTDYLLIITREENTSIAGLSLAQVPTIVLENQRITELEVDTTGLKKAGRYRYLVYGQNSAVNTDPLGSDVVGLVEQGWLNLTEDKVYFTPNISTISNDVRESQ